jgi:orotidine-5'-phosphate decarboxylase
MNPIIVALDVPNATEARALVAALGDSIGYYKVGLELFTAEGPAIVRELVAAGKQVFLDLKMNDIGAQVERAARSVAALGASLLTVHATPQAVAAAKRGAAGTQLKILAVTVLTSYDQSDLEAIGITGRTVAEQVEFLARQAVAAGTDGLVCSPLEVARLRQVVGPDVILLVPGVRSAGADAGDQKRVATPKAALEAGAHLLVVGREITRADSPRAAALNIINNL